MLAEIFEQSESSNQAIVKPLNLNDLFDVSACLKKDYYYIHSNAG